MRELLNDPFYELMKNYPRCIIDYCLIQDDTPHQGYRSHKDAILFAMLKVMERYIDTELKSELEYCRENQDESFPWKLDIEKAHAQKIDPNTLFHLPKITKTDHIGKRSYADPLKNDQIPYWYAFWETPHISGYGPDDFCKVNSILFPKGTDELEAYKWTTNWSNYFDDGHEWWGTACWSIYDKRMNRYVVIMASTTD